MFQEIGGCMTKETVFSFFFFGTPSEPLYFYFLFLATVGLRHLDVVMHLVKKCNRACDNILAIYLSYMHFTAEYRQRCHVGDQVGGCKLVVFQDALFLL